MKALIVEPHGPAPVRYGDWPDPDVRPGWALVAVRAAALNRNDAMLVEERETFERAHVIGGDGAGIVVGVGDGVDPAWVSREVVVLPSLGWGPSEEVQAPGFGLLGYPIQGTFAEVVSVPAENLFAKPARLSWHEAATLPLAGVTAWRATVTKAQAGPGRRLLVTGASGGVSTFVVQIAAALGAEVSVTTSSEDKLERLLALGASAGVVRSEGWPDRLEGGFDAIIDSAAADWPVLLGLLRPGGRLVSLGRTAQGFAEVDAFALFWRQLTITGTSMGSPAEFGALLDHVASATWSPVVDEVFPLADGARAFASLDAPHFGKVVLDIPQVPTAAASPSS